jgi:hypothetical protein
MRKLHTTLVGALAASLVDLKGVLGNFNYSGSYIC